MKGVKDSFDERLKIIEILFVRMITNAWSPDKIEERVNRAGKLSFIKRVCPKKDDLISWDKPF